MLILSIFLDQKSCKYFSRKTYISSTAFLAPLGYAVRNMKWGESRGLFPAHSKAGTRVHFSRPKKYVDPKFYTVKKHLQISLYYCNYGHCAFIAFIVINNQISQTVSNSVNTVLALI
jgi:hypothetical protein